MKKQPLSRREKWQRTKEQIRRHPILTAVYVVLRLVVAVLLLFEVCTMIEVMVGAVALAVLLSVCLE